MIRFEKIPIISKKQLSTWSGHKRHKLMEINRGRKSECFAKFRVENRNSERPGKKSELM